LFLRRGIDRGAGLGSLNSWRSLTNRSLVEDWRRCDGVIPIKVNRAWFGREENKVTEERTVGGGENGSHDGGRRQREQGGGKVTGGLRREGISYNNVVTGLRGKTEASGGNKSVLEFLPSVDRLSELEEDFEIS